MKSFDHISARTIPEAVSLLEDNPGGARLIAGGTDLLGVLKGNILPEYPQLIIDIKTIRSLDYVKEIKGGLKIGALTTLAEIAENPLIKTRFNMLSRAASSIATAEIRNMGTIGGNLCQDIRCIYYRYPHQIGERLLCWRKGERRCLAVSGDNRYHAVMEAKKCFAACPSDMATALAALDATLIIAGPAGNRKIPVCGLFGPLGNTLGRGEMITETQIPHLSQNTGQEFIKFRLREAIDFAIVSVAAVITYEAGTCKNARISLGGVAPMPVRATRAEQLLQGNTIDEETALSAAEAAVSNAHPLSQNAYKIELVKTLIRRALLSILDKAHG